MKRLLLLVSVAISTAVGAQTPKKVSIESNGYEYWDIEQVDTLMASFGLNEKWVFDFETNILSYSNNYPDNPNVESEIYRENRSITSAVNQQGIIKVKCVTSYGKDKEYVIDTKANTMICLESKDKLGRYTRMDKHPVSTPIKYTVPYPKTIQPVLKITIN
jgi:hypothetical protein